MTIVSEISRIKDNISQAYNAAEEKGATLPENRNSENLSSCIESISSGGGDVVTAVNYSGTSIKEGQKVFLAKQAAVAGSNILVGKPGSSNNYNYTNIINRAGDIVYLISQNRVYNINDGSTTNVNGVNYINAIQSKNVNYINGKLYLNIYEVGSLSNVGMVMISKNIAIEGNFATGYASSFKVYKLDDSGSIIHTWTAVGLGSEYYKNACVVKNKIYMSSTNDSHRYVGTLDDSSSTINMTKMGSIGSCALVYATSDDKIGIGYTGYNSDSDLFFISLYFVRFNENGEVVSVFITNNSDLSNLMTNNSNVYVFYNRETNILAVSSRTNQDNYGLFRYDPSIEDFVTIPLELPKVSGNSTYYALSVTDDLSYVLHGFVLYKMAQEASDKYRAISYKAYIGDDILTGIASSDADALSEFEATTILPKEE